LDDGIKETEIATRQKLYGSNKHTEKPPRSFWTFVWDALHDLTLIILIVCAVVSLMVGLATEGWPKGIYDGLGIITSILLVVLVTASSDYKQSRKFMELDCEKKKIHAQESTKVRKKTQMPSFKSDKGNIAATWKAFCSQKLNPVFSHLELNSALIK
jgi:magnesium-transporting ATPase (P-type)